MGTKSSVQFVREERLNGGEHIWLITGHVGSWSSVFAIFHPFCLWKGKMQTQEWNGREILVGVWVFLWFTFFVENDLAFHHWTFAQYMKTCRKLSTTLHSDLCEVNAKWSWGVLNVICILPSSALTLSSIQCQSPFHKVIFKWLPCELKRLHLFRRGLHERRVRYRGSWISHYAEYGIAMCGRENWKISKRGQRRILYG